MPDLDIQFFLMEYQKLFYDYVENEHPVPALRHNPDCLLDQPEYMESFWFTVRAKKINYEFDYLKNPRRELLTWMTATSNPLFMESKNKGEPDQFMGYKVRKCEEG